MTVKPDFSRRKELLWFPILEEIGFHGVKLSSESLDQEEGVDIEGYWGTRRCRIAARERDFRHYSPQRADEYTREFTIRYSRPSGVPTEWEKIFSSDFPHKPDYLAYGWVDAENRILDGWGIFDLGILREMHGRGWLRQYEERNLKTNVDARRSSFVHLPIPELARLTSLARLMPWYSPAHPALPHGADGS